MMLIADFSDNKNTIELHQDSASSFVLLVNGEKVQRFTQGAGLVEQEIAVEWVKENINEVINRGKQVSKAAKVAKTMANKLEAAKTMSRPEFIASQIIRKTAKSNGDKLTRRADGNFDICFMNIPVWSNISIEMLEVWTSRTGLCLMASEAREFWMEANA